MNRYLLWIAIVLFSLNVGNLRAAEFDDAVAAVQQIVTDNSIPEDWLATQNEPDGADPLVLAAIWNHVDTECAKAVKDKLGLEKMPRGALVNGFASNSPAYEEVVMTALYGDNHEHLRLIPSYQTKIEGIPNVRPALLASGGKVNFDKLAERLEESVKQEIGVNAEATRVKEGSYCLVVTPWIRWSESNLDWIRDGYACRGLFFAVTVTGKREFSFGSVDGSSRLALTLYVEVGRKHNNGFQRILRSPPLRESSFSPVGQMTVKKEQKSYEPQTRDHPGVDEELDDEAYQRVTKELRDNLAETALRSSIVQRLVEVHGKLGSAIRSQ